MFSRPGHKKSVGFALPNQRFKSFIFMPIETGDGANRSRQRPFLETIKFRDIPQRILDEILEVLRKFAVSITVIHRERDLFQGSCTCVKYKGQHFLFTAAHVWEELKAFEQLGLVVCRRPSSTVKIRTQELKPIIIGKSENGTWNEWGPDIAFLELSDAAAENIKVFRKFWDLGNKCEISAPLQGIGIAWVIMGAPDERITQIGGIPNIEMRASICPAHAVCMRSGFDYVDLLSDTTIPKALRTHGGMSGSGLWRIRLLRNRDGNLAWAMNELSLEGIAFWEELKPTVNGCRIIRCHGRKSLYGEGLAAIDAFLQ